MEKIIFVDRSSRKEEVEQVYGEKLIKLMYGSGVLSSLVSILFKPLICTSPVFSHLYGLLQKSGLSKKKVLPFIKYFNIDEKEFLDSADSYNSFNEFFTRKLNKSVRPIAGGNDIAILPADARYLFFPQIEQADGFLVKGKKFSLSSLLQDEALARSYEKGSMVIARLCPTDYHRFHFPVSCIAGHPKLINGALFSVNPLALKKNISIFTENKRVLTKLTTRNFGTVLFIEVGATCVGDIQQTFQMEEPQAKGDEKGYFSFGGSSLILLFEPGKIAFDQDLLEASNKKIEIKALMGQSMGRSLSLL
ncbi:MAG: phosphatidylserine decarboxylase [Chlamydiae bacterium]|nr:phosphatidylserine decarboxylase [Chlamydiota bacterium]